MEAKRQKLMDQSEIDDLIIYDPEEESESMLGESNTLIDDLIIYDPEEESESMLGESNTINSLIEVVDLCEPESDIVNLEICNQEKELQSHNGESESNLIGVVDGEPELHDIDVEAEDGTLTDDEKLKGLLTKWNSMNFYEPLRSNNINYCNLHSLEDMDYSMLLRNNTLKLKELFDFRDGHREWKKTVTQNSIDLKQILENGGTEITSYYKANSKLTDPLRERLVAIIIKGRVLSRGMMDNLADQICSIFPGEIKSVYYEHTPSKQPTGLLYVRYCQSRTTKAMAKSVASEATGDEDVTVLLTDEIQMSVDFVNDEVNFRDLSRTTLLFEHWRSCYAYRYSKKYTAAEVLNELPLLRESDAIPMILDDFLTKYGSEIANSMTTKWTDFLFKNMTVISDAIKNPRPKRDLLQAQSENDCNARDLSTLMAFHNIYYIVPTKCTVNKKTWTPSIPESQEAFLKTVTNSNAIASRMKAHKALFDVKGVPDHPIIFEVKNSRTRNYFVAVCQTIYSCSSLIEAVDAAFKYYVMFNIPFPPQCVKF